MKNKMKNIHVIQTDKPSRMAYDFYEKFYLLSEDTQFFEFQNLVQNRELYITSDEEIENCWFVNLTNNEIGYIKNNIGTQKNAKKIILTTDIDLIKDGVQAIDDDFLEWFIKNPSCEEVFLTNDFEQVNQDNPILRGSTNVVHKYKIIIPKEPKQETTLEEAAREYYKRGQLGFEKAADTERAFLRGAKWQQEQDDKYFDKYMKSEKVSQIERMAKLGINTTGQCFEQMVTSLIIQQEQDKNKYSEEEIMNALHSVELKYNRDFTKIYEGVSKYLKELKNK